MKYFDPTVPATKSKIQSKAIRDNFNALNERTDQLTVYATIPPSTGVYITPASKVYFDNNRLTTFSGQIFNFGDPVTGVYNFTNQYYYKEIILYYYYDDNLGVGKVDYIEGYEIPQPIFNTEKIINDYNYQFKNGIKAQTNLLKNTIILCSILVRNNGLLNQRGQIQPITNDNIIDLRPFLSKVYTDEEIKKHINTTTLSEAHPNAKIFNDNIASIIAVVLDNVVNNNTIRINPLYLWDGSEERKNNIKVGDLVKIPVGVTNTNLINNNTIFLSLEVVNVDFQNGIITVNKNININAGNLIIKPLITYDKLLFSISETLKNESNIIKKESGNYVLNDEIVFNGNIAPNANISRDKIAVGNSGYVVINSPTGKLSEEMYLSKSRGGIGKNAENIIFPDEGTLTTLNGEETLTNKKIVLKNGSQTDYSLKFESNHGFYSDLNNLYIRTGTNELKISNDGYVTLNRLTVTTSLINNININTFKASFDSLSDDYTEHKNRVGNLEIHHTHVNYNNINSINQNLSTNSNVQFLNLYLSGELDVVGKIYLNYNDALKRYHLPTNRGEYNTILTSEGENESTSWKSISDLNLVVCDTTPEDGYATIFYNGSKKLKSSKLYIDEDGNITCGLINGVDINNLELSLGEIPIYDQSLNKSDDVEFNSLIVATDIVCDKINGIDIVELDSKVSSIPIFDQSLNKSDNVEFNNVKVNGILYIDNKISFFGGDEKGKLNLSVYTPEIRNVDYLGMDGYALVTELNDLRTAYENLRLAYEELRSKLIEYGLF